MAPKGLPTHPSRLADIFNNLHKQVGKTAVTKALGGLVEKGEVTEKAYGKQQVFVIRQDSLPTPSPEELATLDAEVQQLQDALAAQREKTKLVQSRMRSFGWPLCEPFQLLLLG